MQLSETQAWFFARMRSGPQLHADPSIVASDSLAASRRVEIYRDMYSARFIDALEVDFPRTKKALGAGAFSDLVKACVEANPATHYSLDHYGRCFPAFLARSEHGVPKHIVQLARLEWAVSETFLAPQHKALTLEALQHAAEDERFVELRLQMCDALCVLEHDYALFDWWDAVSSDEGQLPSSWGVTLPEEKKEILLVWRQSSAVNTRVLELSERDALVTALAGRTMAEIAETFADDEDPSQAFLQTLLRWTQNQLITSLLWPPIAHETKGNP